MVEYPVNEKATEDLFRKRTTLLRIFLHIPEPEKLSDDEFAQRWAEFEWASKSGFLPIEIK